MSETIRVGLIGCGGIVHGHVQRLLALPEAKIVALCDPSEASVQRLKERHPAVRELPVYRDHRELLEKEKLDAVEIASPHTLHFPQIMDALSAGLHVLSEKPMVCTVEHAHQVLRKAEESGKLLLLSYQRHFQGPFRYMRQRFQNGDMGQLVFLSALQGQQWLRGTRGTWRQDPA
ncbi:MAG: Gfo/Idh/MocA family oxidoreductase, partial [Armatimonadota bacterium]|nr:Gfo/Idh/MocA family oxidoreductase [Armatimonadota bacterium]